MVRVEGKPWSLVTLALTSLACASGVGRSASDPNSNPQGRRVVEVENRNFQRMDVSLEAGGRRYHLGEVPPFGLARFRVPAGASGSAARLAFRGPGEVLFYETQLVRFAGAQELSLVIGPDVRQSTLVARE